MTDEQDEILQQKLEALRLEHRDLDDAIEQMRENPGANMLQIQRLKKRKLSLKDEISRLSDQLTPDIIA